MNLTKIAAMAAMVQKAEIGWSYDGNGCSALLKLNIITGEKMILTSPEQIRSEPGSRITYISNTGCTCEGKIRYNPTEVFYESCSGYRTDTSSAQWWVESKLLPGWGIYVPTRNGNRDQRGFTMDYNETMVMSNGHNLLIGTLYNFDMMYADVKAGEITGREKKFNYLAPVYATDSSWTAAEPINYTVKLYERVNVNDGFVLRFVNLGNILGWTESPNSWIEAAAGLRWHIPSDDGDCRWLKLGFKDIPVASCSSEEIPLDQDLDKPLYLNRGWKALGNGFFIRQQRDDKIHVVFESLAPERLVKMVAEARANNTWVTTSSYWPSVEFETELTQIEFCQNIDGILRTAHEGWKNKVQEIRKDLFRALNNEKIQTERRRDLKVRMAENPEVLVTTEDSYATGNCRVGTEEFMRKFSLESPKTLGELLKHRSIDEMLLNSYFRRVIERKLDDNFIDTEEAVYEV